MPLLARLKTLVDERTVLEQPYTITKSEPVSSSLYQCTTCETTYIDSEMEACPACDVPVDEVPSTL